MLICFTQAKTDFTLPNIVGHVFGGNSNVGVGGLYDHPNGLMTDLAPTPTLLSMLASRLRLSPGQNMGFDHINAFQSKSTVYLFIVHQDNSVVLEDSPDLFPSDTLMTQIRLLRVRGS